MKKMLFLLFPIMTVTSVANADEPLLGISESEMSNYGHVGYIQSKTTSSISIKTSGIVDHWSVDVGDVVSKGDPIVELEETNQKFELEKIKSQVDYAKTKMESYKKLKDKQYQTEIEYLSSVYDYKSSMNDLDVYQRAYDNLILEAPFDGVIQSRNIQVGEFVSQGQEIVTLVDNKNLEVYVDTYQSGGECLKKESCYLYFKDGDNLVGPMDIDYVVPLQENGMIRAGAYIEGDYPYGISKYVFLIPKDIVDEDSIKEVEGE